ncbi:MAG: sigma-54-dependent transcriptional regulator [Prevotella sp.]
MKKGKILIVDDNEALLVSLRMLLSDVFADIATNTNPNLIPSLLRSQQPDVVLLDMNFGRTLNNGNEGIYWLSQIRRQAPSVSVVLFTAYADIDLAVRGIKEGAADFIVKPFDNDVLISKLKALVQPSSKASRSAIAPECYWGTSPAMQQLHGMVEKVAVTDANILIIGENGTGKEVLAREIHRLSFRSDHKMVTVDMGAITETLFESELFGHVRGAFTDAKADKPGKMEMAQGSTLFMDEIGNLSYGLQAKLLTALQRRTIMRLGGTREIPIDIRLVTATNRNPQQMVQEGTFREDLLYRINTICLHLPPLRERRQDIVPLAELFIKKYSDFYNKTPLQLDANTCQQLLDYHWPGNIRELEHAMERAVILGEATVPQGTEPQCTAPLPPGGGFSHTDYGAQLAPPAGGQGGSLASMERDLIARTIHECDGNLSLVAQRLDIARQTLYNKIKKYGL